MDDSLFRELEKNAIRNTVPIGGKFELTPRCTLDCKMCYVHLNKDQLDESKELATSDWLKIIDAALDNGLVYALLTGGECMLHRGFAEIYEHIQQRGCIVTINTNAFVLTEKHFELFRKYPPRGINISLYGASEDTYEAVTGVRAYERVLSNIHLLKELGIHVSISITPSRPLLPDVLKIIDFCRNEGLKYNITYSLNDAREDTGRSIESFGLTAEEELNLRSQVFSHLGFTPYDNPKELQTPALQECPSEYRGVTCKAGKCSYFVTWDGVMHPCQNMLEIGASLLENDFSSAWNQVSFASKQVVRPAECESCELLSKCTNCYIKRANPDDPDHCNPDLCERTKRKIANGLVKF